MLRDLRLAARSLLRAPAFTITAVLSLGLAIAGSASAFGVLDAIRFRALPFRDAERLVLISEIAENPAASIASTRTQCRLACSVSYDTYAQVIQRQRFQSLDAVTAFTSGLKSLNANGDVAPVTAGVVSSNIFQLLGATPILGRGFVPDDDRLGVPLVTLMSHAAWQTHFAGDPGVIGSTVRLSDSRYVVVGVMPPAFRFESGSDFWLPAVPTLDPSTRPSIRSINVVGRLAPGYTIEQLQQELRNVRTLAAAPAGGERTVLAAAPLRTRYVAATQSHDVIFAAIVGCLLLIAAANLASLALARVLHQRQELAVRTALGASVWRVGREWMAQNALVVGASIGLGLVVASATVTALESFAAFDTLRADGMDYRVDWRVAVFTMLVGSVLVALLTLIPVRIMRREDIQRVLREGGTRAGSRPRALRAFVALQIAFTLVLLTGAALMMRSALHFARVQPGFDAAALVSASPSYPHPWRVPETYLPKTQEITAALAAIPGASRVAVRAALPLPANSLRLDRSSQPLARGSSGAPAVIQSVGPDYFATVGVRVVSGREFDARDVASGAPVAVVNQWAAAHWWPRENAVGRTIMVDTAPGKSIAVGIVGIVADNKAARGNVMLAEDAAELYRPYAQAHSAFPQFLVRASATPAQLLRPVRETLIRLVPDRPVFAALPSETIAQQLRGARVTAAQVLGFAAAGMILAVIGIYGVLAYELGHRRREIGIRAALGAPRWRMTSLVIIDAAKMAAIGIALGIPASVFAMRLLTDAVYPTKPTDPAAFVAVALMIMVVSLLAAWIPAHRAGRVDPMVALRDS